MNSNIDHILSIIRPRIDLYVFNYILGNTIGTGIQRYFLNKSDLSGQDKLDFAEILVTSLDKDIFSNKRFIEIFIARCLDDQTINRISELLKIQEDLSSFQKRKKILTNSNIKLKKTLIEVLQLDEDFFSKQNFKNTNVFEKITPFSPVPIDNENYSELIPKVFLSLHPYQKRIKDRMVQKLLFENSDEKMLIHMPTGSGKTKTSIEGIIDFIRVKLRNSNDGGCVIWFTHSKELSEQAYDSFKNMWKFKGDFPINIYKLFGDTKISDFKPVLEDKVSILFVGFQKYNSILSSKNNDSLAIKHYLYTNTKLAVVDEAHKSLANTYKKAIESVTAMPDCRLVGLTATPGRSNYISGDNENNELSSFFGNTIIRITNQKGEYIDSPLRYLQDKNVLANIMFETLESTIDLTNDYSKNDLLKIFKKNDIGESVLNRIAIDPHRNSLIIAKIKEHFNRGNNILVFAASIDHGIILYNILKTLGIRSSLILGTTDKQTRSQAIEDFKQGRLQVLLNFGVLSTGFDAPKLNTLIITRPTKSVVLYSQMVGRALRGPKNGGNKVNTLVTIKDNLIGFPKPDFMFSYWDEFWN